MSNINLLPWREQRRARHRMRFFIAVSVTLGSTIACLWLSLYMIDQQTGHQLMRNELLQQKITGLNAPVEQMEQLRQQRQELRHRLAHMTYLKRRRARIVQLFNELPAWMPEGAYLTSVSMTHERVSLAGYVFAYADLAALLRRMDASAWLETPELGVVQQADKGEGSQFTITAVIRRQEEPYELAGSERAGP